MADLAASHASVISSNARFRRMDPSETTRSHVGHFFIFMTSNEARIHCGGSLSASLDKGKPNSPESRRNGHILC
jgi:hypothetical protein